MKNVKFNIYSILLLLSLFSCGKEADEPQSQYLMFPAGRSFLSISEIKVLINDQEYKPVNIFDTCGGYWLRIPKADLPENGKISVEYTRRKGSLELYREVAGSRQQWLNESYYIDSNDPVLKAKAIELTKDYHTDLDKAKQIHQFVKTHVDFKIYRDAFLDKASRTYELGYGACMNFSRLYVALCRAVNIPARSIWGVIYGYNNDNIYDYHHQWVEVLDEDGYWHPADFKYNPNFDLNDIRYLDLIYAAEENTVIQNRLSEEIVAGSVKYFNNYPATLTGKLGFELIEDKRPDYMTVKYTYKF